MVYNPATDFLALWRNSGGSVKAEQIPGLDYVVQALARAGIVNLSVSATAPVANQTTTAWLQAAVPSYSAEGVLNLWSATASAYQAATPSLFADFLHACANESGVSWWTCTGGGPSNTIGSQGDLAIRTDEPGGVYGPKGAAAWPVTPLPGTQNIISSSELDNTFGSTQGLMIYRDAAIWKALGLGGANTLLASNGSIPAWETFSALLDGVFSAAEGSILYRDNAVWEALAPGTAGNVLQTGGIGAPPSWTTKTPEFLSGTVMVFQQTAAPIGWTKDVSHNDYGLRVTSGAVGTTPGTGFSTVFAQTTVGNHTLTVGEIPSHTHTYSAVRAGGAALAGGSAPSVAPNADTVGNVTDGGTGGGNPHTHAVSLQLAYIDIIIASKN